MKVRLTVKEIAEARGFKNAKQLADASSIHYKSMYTIWSGEAQLISMDVLGRLCTTLRVQPGMLFESIPDDDVESSGAAPVEAESSPARKAAPGRKVSRKARGASATTPAR